MSAFVALDLDESARGECVKVIDAHRAAVDAKWLRPDKLHLTLVFLGNPDAERLAALAPHVDALAAGAASFELTLHGAGVFVTERAPAVLWLGVAGELPPLVALQRRAAAALGDVDRPFVPHVTLGRAHVPGAFDALAAALAGFRSSPFTARHLTLYESTHHHFRVVHRAPFTARRAASSCP